MNSAAPSRHPLNILVVLLYWYPYSGPHTPIYAGIFRELTKRGHRITILTGFPHFRIGSKDTWDQYRKRVYEATEWESCNLVRTFVFAPHLKNERFSLVIRLMSFLSFSFSSFLVGSLLKNRFNIVLTLSSPPLMNGIVGFFLAKLKGAKSIYNIVDIYPDMFQKLGIWTNGLLLKVLRSMEMLVYRLNPSLVVLSDSMRENLEKKGVKAKQITVIPDFVETEAFSCVGRNNEFAAKYGLTDRFVLMYAGNIGLPHGVEILIEVAERLRDEEDLRLCIVGRGEYLGRIVASVKQRGLSNVVFPPRQPEQMVPLIWASADVSVVTYKPGLAEYSMPSKLLFIMASGRPAIVSADADSDVCTTVVKARCGLNVPPGDATALADAVRYLKSNPELRREMGQRGQEYIKQHFEKMSVVDQFENLFMELSGLQST
jgi:colanic acid biosynthesis glycosyl transferase WcaI